MQLQTVSVSLICLFTTVLIYVSSRYEATCMNEDSVREGDFSEQLSLLTFSKKKSFSSPSLLS